MNPDNLRSLADLPPERRREIARMGGKASGIERARRAYMKQSAREIILKMHYFYEAEEELEAEWKEHRAAEILHYSVCWKEMSVF